MCVLVRPSLRMLCMCDPGVCVSSALTEAAVCVCVCVCVCVRSWGVC